MRSLKISIRKCSCTIRVETTSAGMLTSAAPLSRMKSREILSLIKTAGFEVTAEETGTFLKSNLETS